MFQVLALQYNPCISVNLVLSCCNRYGQTLDGEKYWLVKNTWSANWGEQGYIRISRNPAYDCGIATQAIYTDIELAE